MSYTDGRGTAVWPRLALAVGMLPIACEPEFHDIYCLDPPSTALPACQARLGMAGQGGGRWGGRLGCGERRAGGAS